jgi:type III secretory pathway component EscU
MSVVELVRDVLSVMTIVAVFLFCGISIGRMLR